jgi:preprotein translocase subunit SecF
LKTLKTKIDFLKLRFIGYTIFATLLIIFYIGGFLRGGINMGIDFVGGAKITAKFSQTINEGEIRTTLAQFDPLIQRMGEKSGNEFMITTKVVEEGISGKGALADVKDKLYAAYPDVQLLSEENIGPAVSGMMARAAAKLIIFSILTIMIYLAYRFEFKYSVAAVVPLVFDVLLSMGFILIMGIEFTIPIVAALLTIFGYSVNDTIVLFDRIRENSQHQAQVTTYDMINKSVNQTLSRTILTTFTTVFAILSLFFLGGDVLHSFATVLLFGISMSVFSTLFFAAPFLYEWEKIKNRKK